MRRLGGSLSLLLLTVGVGTALGVGVAFNSVYAVAVVPAIIMAVVAVVWPREVLLGIVAYIPVESFLLKWLPGGVSGPLSLAPEVILFLAAASALLRPADSEGLADRQKWLLWLAAFFAVGMISAWVSNVAWIDSVYWIRTNVRYMSAALIIGALSDRRWWLRSFVPIVAGGLVFQCGVALIEFVGGGAARLFFAPASMVVGGREFVDYAVTGPAGISGTLGFYNNFGVYSVLATAVCAGAFISVTESAELGGHVGRARLRLMGIAVYAGALNVLLSASRQSVLVFAAGTVAVLSVVGVRRVGRRMLPLLLGLLIFGIAALLAPSLTGPLAWIPERFGQVVGGQAVTQSLQTDRLFALARVVPGVLVISPLLGLGPGALSSLSGVSTAAGALSLSSEGVSYAQDVGWAGIFVQVGLIGFGLLVTLLVWTASLARRLYRDGSLDRGAGATLAATFTIWVTGMVASSPQLVRSTSLLLWCVVGLCLGGYRLATGADEPE